jgi:hypothetical protein
MRRIFSRSLLIVPLLAGLFSFPTAGGAFPRLPSSACPVSTPVRPEELPRQFQSPLATTYFGEGALWTVLWPNGTIVFKPGGPGFVLSDGALGMKWPFLPLVEGDISVTGKRLDGKSAPLRFETAGLATVPSGYQFYPGYLIFPTPGCWEVTGQVGDASLTFVTRVVQIGAGPDWHPDETP